MLLDSGMNTIVYIVFRLPVRLACFAQKKDFRRLTVHVTPGSTVRLQRIIPHQRMALQVWTGHYMY